MPELIASDHGRELVPRASTRGAHPVDPRLPRHWENITPGQNMEERAAAILVNAAIDKRKRPKRITGAEALARIRSL